MLATATASVGAARSPLEPVECSLRFDNHADLIYDFQLQTHQRVSWLMDCSEPADGDPDLPDAFGTALLRRIRSRTGSRTPYP